MIRGLVSFSLFTCLHFWHLLGRILSRVLVFPHKTGVGGRETGAQREGKGPGVIGVRPLLVSSVLASASRPPARLLGQERLRKHPWKPRPAARGGRGSPARTEGARSSVGGHPLEPLSVQHWRDQESSGKCRVDKCREEWPRRGGVGAQWPLQPARAPRASLAFAVRGGMGLSVLGSRRGSHPAPHPAPAAVRGLVFDPCVVASGSGRAVHRPAGWTSLRSCPLHSFLELTFALESPLDLKAVFLPLTDRSVRGFSV